MNGSMNEANLADAGHVAQIIHRLHDLSATPPSLEEQRQLQQTLFRSQQLQEGWALGGQLLSGADPDINVRFFGAHTLTVKISRDWTTLQESDWLSLKDALLSWLAASAASAYPVEAAVAVSGERIVMRKLAVAITSLSFRLAPVTWPNWLLETISRLSSSGCSRTGIYEFLSLAIEEVGRADLVGGKRVQYDQVISDAAPAVARTIFESLSTTGPTKAAELNAALKCLQSWVAKRDFNRNLLGDLYPLVIALLPNEDTCVNACSCAEDIIMDMAFATETRVSPLIEFCTTPEVGSILERSCQEGDVDEISLALFKLLVALLEHSYTQVIANLTSPQSIILLQRLHMLTCFPGYYGQDENISDLGLPIWAYLQEEITDNGIVATQSGFGDPRWATVKEVFDTLVEGLCRKATLPSRAEFITWPKDIKQTFQKYRTDLGDALINSYYVLRNPMLETLVSKVSRQLENDTASSTEDLESICFCIATIHEAVPEDEDEFLQILFQGNLFSVFSGATTPDTVQLRRTILHLIGAYAPWYKSNPTSLLQAVQATVTCLSDPSASQNAARALSALCDACRKDLTGHVASFADLVRNLEGQIPDADFVKVLGSVAAVIQALPADELVAPVVTLVENSISKLGSALASAPRDEARQISMLQLASLTACAKSLSEPEDEILSLDGLADATDEVAKAKQVQIDPRVERLRVHLLEAISVLSSTYRGDAEVSQALSDFLKACTATNLATPLSLNPVPLLSVLASLLESEATAVWFGITSLLLFRLGRQELSMEDSAAVRDAINRGLGVGIHTLPSLAAMEHNPDVVQCFMDFAMSALTSFASILYTLPDAVEAVLKTAIQALEVQERVGLQKSIQLLTALTNEAASEKVSSGFFLAMMQSYGRVALELTLAGVGGKLPRSNLGYLAELLLAFSRRLPNETRVWLKEAFSRNGFPSHRVSQEVKDRYAKSIMSARSLKKLRESTETFAIVCRGLEGTGYAAA